MNRTAFNRQVLFFARHYDKAQLRAAFERIGENPGDRVKKTGLIKIEAARRGDAILAALKIAKENDA